MNSLSPRGLWWAHTCHLSPRQTVWDNEETPGSLSQSKDI